MRNLFAAFGMSLAKVGHAICKSACFVNKVNWLFVLLRRSLAVHLAAKAIVSAFHLP